MTKYAIEERTIDMKIKIKSKIEEHRMSRLKEKPIHRQIHQLLEQEFCG